MSDTMERPRIAPGATHRLTSDPVTTTQLVKYAGASGDFNRIHFDHPFAEKAGLGGVIAHGMLTMAFAGRCVSEMAGDPRAVRSFSARFLAPVRVGDVVEVEAEVTGVADGIADVEIVGAVGGTVVLKGLAQLRTA